MDFRDSPEEAEFRENLRAWLGEQKGRFPTSGDAYWEAQGAWHQALYAAGFFGTTWPTEYGGRDLPAVYDVIVDEEIAKAGAPARPRLAVAPARRKSAPQRHRNLAVPSPRSWASPAAPPLREPSGEAGSH